MDPSVFIGAILGAIAATVPGHAGMVCDNRGYCIAQPYYPPPPPYAPPPQPMAPPQHPQQDALGGRVKNEIYEFCGRHPEEKFCGDLDKYLQQHPDAR